MFVETIPKANHEQRGFQQGIQIIMQMTKPSIYVLQGLAQEPLTNLSGCSRLSDSERWMEAARIAFPNRRNLQEAEIKRQELIRRFSGDIRRSTGPLHMQSITSSEWRRVADYYVASKDTNIRIASSCSYWPDFFWFDDGSASLFVPKARLVLKVLEDTLPQPWMYSYHLKPITKDICPGLARRPTIAIKKQ